jgi:hypothetical protein
MRLQKHSKPAFQSVELDPMDARLEAKAAEKGIPMLVSPPFDAAAAEPRRKSSARKEAPKQKARAKTKTLNIQAPDYVWIAVKTRAAQEMVSVRHVIMSALKASGIEIADDDMIEDGRRLRS